MADSSPATAERPPVRMDTVAVVGLFIMGLTLTLRLAKPLLLPIVMSVLLTLLLNPAIRWLKRLRLPEPVGATVVLFAFVLTVGAVGFALAGPAEDWIDRAPTTLRQLESRIRRAAKPLAQLQATAAKVEEAATPGTDPTTVQVATPSILSRLSSQTGPLLDALISIAFLTFLLLASGDFFMKRLATVMPGARNRRTAASIAAEIESLVSRYLFMTTLINIGLALATWAVLALVGMPNAAMWGAAAGLLNYVPYVGGVVTTVVIGAAALVTYPTLGEALLAPGLAFVINMLESNLITPLILGRTFPLNPVALFIGLMFWWFVWGVAGAILAVPIMFGFKVFCDHFEPLEPIGAFLGR